MTKREILDLVNCLSNLKVEAGVKWGYAAARNRDSLMPIVKAVQESREFGKGLKEYEEFEAERQGLIKKHSVDESGNPYVVNPGGNLTRAVHPSNFGAYLDDIDLLRCEYKPLIEEIDRHLAEFEKSLSDEETVKLHMVKPEDVPKGLTQADFNILWPMIAEEQL
jgi:hypothetical protein